MKKLLYSLIVSSLVLVVSTNSSFAQQEQVKKRAKAQLHVTKAENIQRDDSKALQKVDSEQKFKLKARPVKAKAQVKIMPVQGRIEKK